MKPICVRCRRFFRMKKGGFYFTEGMPKNGTRRPEPGAEHDADWQDYKLWVGDLWHCLGCGNEIISGVAYQPLRERHHNDFTDVKERVGATVRINDC